jgi:hypothetical protein
LIVGVSMTGARLEDGEARLLDHHPVDLDRLRRGEGDAAERLREGGAPGMGPVASAALDPSPAVSRTVPGPGSGERRSPGSAGVSAPPDQTISVALAGWLAMWMAAKSAKLEKTSVLPGFPVTRHRTTV